MQKNLFEISSSNDDDYLIKNEMDLIEKDWNIPPEYPDLTGYKQIAIDLETCDPNIMVWGTRT